MEMKDPIESTKSNSSGTASKSNSNGGMQSEVVVQLQDSTAIGDNLTPKVRKPYTITKQREKWTEEEHQKFLNALKLYGRGWRQIEEHIGTKTAVQIRSHAQKFFSKVVRETDGSADSSVQPIDIPPPRPKRKPLHPYPRKSVDAFKGHSTPIEQEKSPSPKNLPVAEKDSQSPTSVLSTFGSEAFGSAFSEQTNRCLSPNSCTTEIHSANLSPVEKDDDCMTSNPSGEDNKGLIASAPLSSGSNSHLCMKSEFYFKEIDCFKEDATNLPHAPTIKLFGITVSMVGNQEFLSVDEQSMNPITKSDEIENVENEKLGQAWPSEKLNAQLSLGMCESNLKITPDGDKVVSTEQPKDNQCSVESVPDSFMPCWSLYQGLPADYFKPGNQVLNPTPLRPSLSVRMREEESSCTGSNAGSVSDAENRGKSSDAVDSQCLKSHEEEEVDPQMSSRGFVPYKRCLAERDSNSLILGLEERKGQRARVCS